MDSLILTNLFDLNSAMRFPFQRSTKAGDEIRTRNLQIGIAILFEDE